MKAVIYLLQVSACSAIFYLFYFLLLRKLTFFTLNRWFLLVTVFLSFLIPAISLPVDRGQPHIVIVQQAVDVNSLQISSAEKTIIQVKTAPKTFDYMLFLRAIYWIVVIGLSVQLIVTLIQFSRKLKGKQTIKSGRVNIIQSQSEFPNGSFLNYIFLNGQELSADELQQIIAHEMLHVKLAHSVDRILIKIAQIVLWFNPFIYAYAKSVEENHEFEVDRALTNSTDKRSYANLLLHLSVAGGGTLYHSFSKVPLKKRIAMLFNKPSTQMKKIIYVLLLPVILISCLAFAKLKNNQPENKVSAINGIEKLGKNPLVLIDDKVYPKSILYEISRSCIKGIGFWDPQPKLKKHGVFIKDGCVEISTKNNKISYLMQPERENLIKTTNIPQNQFYTRLRLHDLKKGGFIDKIIMQKSGSKVTADLPVDGKAVFFINHKLYGEQQVKKLPQSVINSLSGEDGVTVGHLQNFEGIDVSRYDAVFYFNSKSASDTTKYQQKLKRTSEQIKSQKEFKAYAQSDEFKQKAELAKVNLQQQDPSFKVTRLSYRVPEIVLEPLKKDQSNSYIAVGKAVTIDAFKKERERVYKFVAAMLPDIQQKDIAFSVDTTLQKGTCTVMTIVRWEKPMD